MDTRKNVIISGIPFKWTTNLTDEEICEFYSLYAEQIKEPVQDARAKGEKFVFVIPIRMGFLNFQDGVCFWSATADKQTVLYRSNRDWQLWNARQQEIAELREEQAAELAAEQILVLTEDKHLDEKTEIAINAGDYDAAAACITSRAELRETFKQFRVMPVKWTYWYPDLIFAKFPVSQHGIKFFSLFRPLPQSFINFGHWFSTRCGLKSDALVEQTRKIYEEGIKMFPDSGNLAQAASLFFRRVGKYELAMNVCLEAIKRGLQDGTKSGFEGRLKRLQRELKNSSNGD